ncbi:MAG: hypothetical protein PHT94_05285 [Candidatus Nanoarchaeia archaeon]|nr:hypothetical protein [Candidatus Nanoarchaeia archaeon]
MKNYIYILVLMMILFSGCNNLSNYTEILSNEENYNREINISGKIKNYNNGYYYIVDSKNFKLKLIDCYDKYDIKLGNFIKINGYIKKENNSYSFICDQYDLVIKNFTSELNLLQNKIENIENDMISVNIEKQKEIDRLNNLINEKNNILNEKINLINSKEKYINELNYKIDNITKEKEIEYVKTEITSIAHYFPKTPSVEDFKNNIVGVEPYRTHDLRIGCCEIIGYRDWYYKISRLNKNYTITIFADRSSNTDFYNSYTIIVEREDEKWTFTRN